MQKQVCFFCNQWVELIHVHGHYQCPVCNTNALPCCDGDICETNYLLQSVKEKSQPQHATDFFNDIKTE